MRPVRTFRLDDNEYVAVKDFLTSLRGRSVENKPISGTCVIEVCNIEAEGLKNELDKAKAVIVGLQNELAVLRNKEGV